MITIHLKGFASRLNFQHEETKNMADSLIDFVSNQLAENFSTVCIIWDGDSYSDDSFTALIPRIYNSLCKTRKIHLIAFVQDEDKYDTKKSFLETWSTKNNMRISLNTTKNFGYYILRSFFNITLIYLH